MSNFNTDFIRRIENFTELENIFPMVGFPAENHVDDNWDDNKIYKGELFINLKTGSLFTANGQEIIQLNSPHSFIISGLEISHPETSGQGITLDIDIEDGYAII